MKLDQLYYLQEAAKYKSISIASEKNYISQPTLSGAITRLEKELGVELLRRNSRGVVPTEVGEIVLGKASEIFSIVDEIFEATSEYGHQGVVNVSSIACICDHIIPQTLSKLRENDSPFMLSITTAESKQIAHNVSSGISALGILIYYPALEENNDLQYTPLFQDEYELYVGPGSPFWNHASISLAEAVAQPYIAYRDEFLKDDSGWTTQLGAGFRPNLAFRTDDLESLKRMIARDNYVAFFPKFMSRDDFYLKKGLVRAIPLCDAQIRIEVGYIESKKYRVTSIDKIFIEVLKDTVSAIPS